MSRSSAGTPAFHRTPENLLHRASCLVASIAALCRQADHCCESETLDQACDLIHEAMTQVSKLTR